MTTGQRKANTKPLLATRFPLLVSVLALTAACASTPEVSEPVAVESEVLASLQRYNKQYVLQRGDQLEVVVYRSPELSRTVTIRPDGYISLPVLDDILAAGRTPTELDAYVTERLLERLREPEVTVIVENLQEPMVYIFNESGNGAAVPLRSARTIAQALAISGGIGVDATLQGVAVVRLNADGFLQATTLENGDLSDASYLLALQNVSMLPDDVILVPRSSRAQFRLFVQDFISTPLGALNQVLSPYIQFRILDEVVNTN